MKIQKPTFDSTKQVYTSDITEGFRCEAKRGMDGRFSPPFPSFYTSMKNTFLDSIIQQTTGWFRKPLTKDWLDSRVVFHFPTETIPEGFEGTCGWEMKQLFISKEKFDFQFALVDMKEDEKVLISFDEDKEEEMTRRKQHKEQVLKLRERAARALFQAERATQNYCQVYGEDTDWETDEENE